MTELMQSMPLDVFRTAAEGGTVAWPGRARKTEPGRPAIIGLTGWRKFIAIIETRNSELIRE